MTPRLALRIATYLLVADAVAALFIAGLVGSLGLGLIGAALALAWWRGGLSRSIAGLDRILVLAVAAAATIHLVYVAASPLDGFVSLLLLLVLLRLFTARSLGDLRDAGLLSFFMLVASASVAFGIGLLFAFAGFLALGTWMLMLHHVVSESERAEQDPATPGLFRLSLAGSLAAVLITASLFFIIPRVGQASLPIRAELRRMITGFTSQVELGAIGEIETDTTVVMRVSLPDTTLTPAERSGLRWRGLALDLFDGRGWTASRPERRALRAIPPGVVRVGVLRGRGRILTQEIFLEPIGTDVIFAAPRVLSVQLAAPGLLADDTGGLSVPAPSARLHYTVESELEQRPGEGTDIRPLDPVSRARYLKLPPLPERIPALARQLTAGSGDGRETARRLTDFLTRNFRYSLTQARTAGVDPLEDFLFVRRSGNCEYFATALAIMLRTVGVPSRVVNGFQRGEWNPYGEYFAVRLSDAHSWVEAYVEGAGWLTFDASPRDETGGSAWGPLALYLDTFRLRWYRYVVNWSLKDQIDVASAIRQTARTWRPDWPSPGEWTGARAPVLLGVVLVAAVVAWRLRRSGPVGRRALARRAVPDFYRRALRLLARRGIRPAGPETAREFSARVRAAAPAWAGALDTITRAYERARFDTARLVPEDLAAIDRSLAILRRPDLPPDGVRHPPTP
jgi:transglutaminase-like putative cysteine protease